MTFSFDQHGINHMITAISREMTPKGRRSSADVDTLFMGGLLPSEADETALGHFGLRKNYKIIFASFDPANVTGGPVEFHAVITDGLTQAMTLSKGGLWKRDPRSAAILLFPDVEAIVKISSKGRSVFRDMSGRYHDHGFDLARQAVIARAAGEPGKVPVVSSIGTMLTVVDIETVAHCFAVAA